MLALKVEDLSKQYRLGQIGTGTLSHDLNRLWARVRGKEDPYAKIGATNDRTQKAASDYVWALKDINFEIEQGDAVGIIGRNGAGKSTLLKILSRTTLPTTGSVKVKGRIASLLEVGTGFHPEMTGRENIYQNGALLGMTRSEIKRKFDEIVDFSGCEAYIDTPVKRYSSGMYVRLAFAVAAHLESEILIVDEVLAVGDAEFQKKCLGKMNDVSKSEGRTVLFVSHNMAAVKSLCNKGIVIENGNVICNSSTSDALSIYMKNKFLDNNKMVFNNEIFNEYFNLKKIAIRAFEKNEVIDEFNSIVFDTEIEIKKLAKDLKVVYVLKTNFNEVLFTFSHSDIELIDGINHIECIMPNGFLNIGEYSMDFYLIYNAKDTYYRELDLISFRVVEGERPIGSWMGREPGFIKPKFQWNLK
jgi:lipopolysaccharide transport system ATP-binding protein